MSKNLRTQDENIGLYRNRKMLEMLGLGEGQGQEVVFLRKIVEGSTSLLRMCQTMFGYLSESQKDFLKQN